MPLALTTSETRIEISINGAGQTTWKRPEVARALEADECYFFKADKLDIVSASKARKSVQIADYPNPDLAIEVDRSPPKVDRPAIYSALQIAELWRFDGEREQVVIEQLGSDGFYHAAEGSKFLPIRAEKIRRWVVEEDSRDESS